MTRPLLALALCLAPSCALPHGPDHGMMPLEAMSFGVASRLDGDGARTGLALAGYSAGTSRIGSYAAVRFDSVAGLDLLLDNTSDGDDDGDGSDSVRYDEYDGAFVYSMGVVFRATDELGIGNRYRRENEVRDGRDVAILGTLYWGGNIQSGILWTPTPELGVDFGYDTFDDSCRLALVARW
jgi:hypothetical protein